MGVLHHDEAVQVTRLCQEIRDRAVDEWHNAKLGTPIATDKPIVMWTCFGDKVDHPRPPEGAIDDDADTITSNHA
eukprot:4788808-Lingulodinium_polyedra.AAC.1